MIAKLKCMVVTYKKIQLPPGQGAKLRGFFAGQDPADETLHQHTTDGVLYRYPRVQYKILRKNPVVVAFEEGIGAVYPKVMECDRLTIGGRDYDASDMEIKLCEKTAGDSREALQYRFLTPWLCLNQQNYQLYETLEAEGRAALLEKILIGNILSFAKGFGLTVENELRVTLDVQECRTRLKDTWMRAFSGTFTVNYRLPSFCGIGKSVSRGFGTVAFAHTAKAVTEAGMQS